MIHNADQYSGRVPRTDQNVQTEPGREHSIQVLHRAAAALDEIAAAPGQLRLVDLGTQLGLAKSTVRRLAVGLVNIGFAAVDDNGRFALGDRLLGLGTADNASLAAMFRPVLEGIARSTGETVDLSVQRGQQMLFIDQIESAHRLRAVSAIGVRFPMESTANGKAAIATRIKLGDSQKIVAIAETSKGEFFSASADVIVTLAACLEDPTI